jgi:hypothetical protein
MGNRHKRGQPRREGCALVYSSTSVLAAARFYRRAAQEKTLAHWSGPGSLAGWVGLPGGWGVHHPALIQHPGGPSDSSSSAPQVVCRGRRHLALVTRAKCALHGGREFLVHPLELLGRIGAEIIARLREVAPNL